MDISLERFSRVHRFVFGALVVGALFSASVALADIISGLATTGLSNNVTITNLTIDKPADAAQGDVMIASIAIHDGNTVSATAPSGWTLIQRTDNDTNIGIASYWKVAGASEPANYTWALSPQTRAAGGITRYSGVDTANPIDASAGNIGRGTVATTSPITTSADNAEVIAVYALHVGGNNHAGAFFSTPADMTEKYDVSKTAAGPTSASSDAVQVTAGASGSKSSNIAGAQQRDWASQQIALRMRPVCISFDNLTEGAIGGQDNWTGSGLVQSAVFTSATHSLLVGTGASHPVAHVSSGILTAHLRRDNNENHLILALQDNDSTDEGVFSFLLNQDGNVSVEARGSSSNVSSRHDFMSPVQTGVWYKFDAQFDLGGQGVRFRVNDGAWTDWDQIVNSNPKAATWDRVRIWREGTAGASYVDDICLN